MEFSITYYHPGPERPRGFYAFDVKELIAYKTIRRGAFNKQRRQLELTCGAFGLAAINTYRELRRWSNEWLLAAAALEEITLTKTGGEQFRARMIWPMELLAPNEPSVLCKAMNAWALGFFNRQVVGFEDIRRIE